MESTNFSSTRAKGEIRVIITMGTDRGKDVLPCLTGIEVFSGAHHGAREWPSFGHTVRPMATVVRMIELQ